MASKKKQDGEPKVIYKTFKCNPILDKDVLDMLAMQTDQTKFIKWLMRRAIREFGMIDLYSKIGVQNI